MKNTNGFEYNNINMVNEKHWNTIKDKITNDIFDLGQSHDGFCLDIETCYTDSRMLTDNSIEKERKTYAVGIMNVNDDEENLLICENLEGAIEQFRRYLIKQVDKDKNKGRSVNKSISIDVGIHNVKYENSYLRFVLKELGYVYDVGEFYRNKDNSIGVKGLKYAGTYNIIKADGIEYGTEIVLHDTVEKQYEIKKGKNKGQVKNISYIFHIKFWDTLKIAQTPLEKAHTFIGEVDEMYYKLNKDYDYDKVREDNHILDILEIEYLYNDLYLTKHLITDFYLNTLLKLKTSKGLITCSTNKKTCASISFDMAQQYTFFGGNYKEEYRKYFELDKRAYLRQDIKDMERKSYLGGWTHANPLIINTLIENILGSSVDKNSSYPSTMAFELLPYGAPKEFNSYEEYRKFMLTSNEYNEDNSVFIINIGFDYFKPKKKEYDLEMIQLMGLNATKEFKYKSYRDYKKKIQNGNTFISTNIFDDGVVEIYREGNEQLANYNRTITSVEFEHYKKYIDFGCFEEEEDLIIDEELEFNGFKTGKVLLYKAEKGKYKEYIQELYNLKGDVKEKIEKGEQGLESLYAQIKVLLNSLYGKFGSKTLKTRDREYWENGLYHNDKGGKIFNKENFESDDFNDIIDEYNSTEYYVPFASFVTAYARCEIQKMIIEGIGVENFLYTDTDSIYTRLNKDELVKSLAKIGMTLDKVELGKWDLEHEFDSFKTLGAKKYMLNDIKKGICVACAGVPKKAQNILAKQGYNEFYLGKKVEGKLQSVLVKGGIDLLPIEFEIKDTLMLQKYFE